MLKITIKALQILIISVLLGSCSIIFEDDISDEVVIVIMPSDGSESDSQQQLFWWETVGGVIKYNLQIIEGSFPNPYDLVVDTNVAGDKFLIDLVPGEYEWRIRGWNNNSETDYFYSMLTIADTTTINEE